MVSVIIPVFNAEEFIIHSYHQVLEQQLELFEIIFVNNNSSDNSVALIVGLMANDARIQLFHEPKQGAAAARNLGLKQAKGTYIYFFDVDDMIYENGLKSMRTILINNSDIDVVFGKRSVGEFLKDPTILNSDKVEFIKTPILGLRWFDQFSLVIGPPGYLYRKNIFEKAGNFPEELLIGEDAALNIKMGLFANVSFLDRLIYHYHRHQNSSVSINNSKMDKTNTYWKQYIKFYIPYYKLNKSVLPVEFKHILNKHLTFSMGKFLMNQNSLKERSKMFNECKSSLDGHRLPFLASFFMELLRLSGNEFIFKIYVKFYYLIYSSRMNIR